MKSLKQLSCLGIAMAFLTLSSCSKSEDSNSNSGPRTCICTTTTIGPDGVVISTTTNTFESEEPCSSGNQTSSAGGASITIVCN